MRSGEQEQASAICAESGKKKESAHDEPRHRGHVGASEALDVVILQDLQAFKRSAERGVVLHCRALVVYHEADGILPGLQCRAGGGRGQAWL